MRISDWSSDVCSSDLEWLFTTDSGHSHQDGFEQDSRKGRRDRGGESFLLCDLCGLCAESLNPPCAEAMGRRAEEHTSELQSLMRVSYGVFCCNKQEEQPEPNNDILASTGKQVSIHQ